MSRLLAGAAAHNAGQYGVARTIWAREAPISTGESDGDERLLDGLAAFETVVVESRRGDWDAALDAATEAELAADAVDAADQDRVDLAPVERWLTAFAADPEITERSPPPTLAVDGDRPTPGALPLPAAAVVAGVVAAARGDDPDVIADALRFARGSEHPESTRYATFVRDYAAADSGERGIVFERLSGIVARQRRKEEDVSGLFE